MSHQVQQEKREEEKEKGRRIRGEKEREQETYQLAAIRRTKERKKRVFRDVGCCLKQIERLGFSFLLFTTFKDQEYIYCYFSEATPLAPLAWHLRDQRHSPLWKAPSLCRQDKEVTHCLTLPLLVPSTKLKQCNHKVMFYL